MRHVVIGPIFYDCGPIFPTYPSPALSSVKSAVEISVKPRLGDRVERALLRLRMHGGSLQGGFSAGISGRDYRGSWSRSDAAQRARPKPSTPSNPQPQVKTCLVLYLEFRQIKGKHNLTRAAIYPSEQIRSALSCRRPARSFIRCLNSLAEFGVVASPYLITFSDTRPARVAPHPSTRDR